jgi:hypothetical protein
MGGNPTPAADAVEIDRYPTGTRPGPELAAAGHRVRPEPRPVRHPRVPRHRCRVGLDGALFVCRYSGGKDVCVVVPEPRRVDREMITGIDGLTRFADPLDLAQHPATGHLYVAEHGGKRLTLVR